MRTLGKIALWFVMVVVCITAVVAGTLYFVYASTEQSEASFVAPVLQGQTLTPARTEWNEPVLRGMFYKPFVTDADVITDLGVFDTTSLTLETDLLGATAWTVTKDGTIVLEGNDLDGANTHMLKHTENGTYHIEVRLTAPQIDGKAYGTQIYRATYTLAVQPSVTVSTDAALQGDVIAVQVSDIMDDSVPTINTDLSLATFTKQGDKYIAYIGVAYNREPAMYTIDVQCGTVQESLSVQVVHRDFEKQTMYMDSNTADSTNNDPNGATQWRNEVWPLFQIADDTAYWQGTFVRPHEGALNTAFGLFRYTYYSGGGSDVSRHGGIDIDGDTGDAVIAPNAGRVVLAMDLIYTGNTVVIEHGNGIKSFFYHMSELNVATGDMVTKGQLIGKVGSTGYSTGPHLHYEVKIGNQSIDPMQLFNGTSGIYFTA